jgi:putative signal transducing protein
MEEQMKCVFVANGEIHAQQVRAFLEAAGISAIVHGEALRHTHGLTLDGLGTVEILVAPEDVAQARALLDSAEAGEFRVPDERGDEPSTRLT